MILPVKKPSHQHQFERRAEHERKCGSGSTSRAVTSVSARGRLVGGAASTCQPPRPLSSSVTVAWSQLVGALISQI